VPPGIAAKEGQTVKIDSNEYDRSSFSSITSPLREQPESATVSGTDSDHPIGEDKTTLSGDHVAVTALATKALASAEIRQDKVEALRQAIERSDYRIEPSEIASAMLWQFE
jgi:flagellar biosynthesis anti-sigma factor FlgM